MTMITIDSSFLDYAPRFRALSALFITDVAHFMYPECECTLDSEMKKISIRHPNGWQTYICSVDEALEKGNRWYRTLVTEKMEYLGDKKALPEFKE